MIEGERYSLIRFVLLFRFTDENARPSLITSNSCRSIVLHCASAGSEKVDRVIQKFPFYFSFDSGLSKDFN